MRLKNQIATLTLLICSLPVFPACADDTLEEAWRHQLEIGLNGASGNSETANIHLGFNTDYADPIKTWKYTSAYDRSKNDGDVSANRFLADLKRAWIWPQIPWFSFLQGRYDWDDFKDWDDRFSASGGIGYQLLKNDSWDFAGRIGLAGTISRGSDEDIKTPELILALDLAWLISEYEHFDFTTAIYPDLDETGEYRNLTAINWAIKMAEARNLAIKLGIKNEYRSTVNEEKEKNDFTYNLSLLWQI